MTAVGRDRRRPSLIAKAARRKEVYEYLRAKEKELGVWEDPEDAALLQGLLLERPAQVPNWSEKRENWKINKYWSDEMKSDFEKQLEDEDVVFIHDNLTVTKSMWRGEHVIYDAVNPDWESFASKS